MRRVYLDHSATTPVRPEVLEAMLPFLKDEAFGNPSTIYSYGREAKKALDEAREKVASLIGARPEEIFFTSGGTEADNLALIGTAAANEKKGRHIITSSIEHHAVLHTAQYLMRHGFKITFLPVTPEGLVRVEDVEEAITDETILISVMHVNNEVGTIQPIKEIGHLARERGIIFHTDAVQSVGKIPVNVDELNVDLLSASSHKIYGPKGVGCLYIRKGTRINPILHGGAQERKRRPGTENMPGIVGFGRAAELAGQELDSEMERLKGLRDKLIDGILNRIEDVQLNGDREKRVATNANFSFRYVEGESLLLSLDMKGICASSGSACTSGSLDPSHVLLAMGIPHEVAHGSVRMTLGRDNTEADIDYVLEVMPEIVARLRSMSPLYNQR
ncbi:Cysteine desulfurase [Moorella glycerini]|uniref:Cysteine desulfurase IscS n=1 Tax=Neomoorella stamsii TaxID=1266720 RepID=A0A9X7J400_9FIRM|nr:MULTISPECIES: cysteine desulfurase NifS [Moorella]PRR75306.1 Cysteine desulfurase [Moorella stamsii]CEP67273.1 Cysteine desulfurase [Moorella glycerini]